MTTTETTTILRQFNTCVKPRRNGVGLNELLELMREKANQCEWKR